MQQASVEGRPAIAGADVFERNVLQGAGDVR
jgi:hypothetical protein